MYKWIAGVYWDEPACDGSQPVFGTWQRAQGETLNQSFKLSLRINDPEFVFFFFFRFLHANDGKMINFGSPVFFNRRWTDQERLLFIIRELQSYRHKRPSKLCCRWEKWPRVKSSPVSSVASDWVAAVCLALTHDLTFCVSSLYFSCFCLFPRWLRWCFVSVHRDAAAVPGERTAATRLHHPCWWASDRNDISGGLFCKDGGLLDS